MIVGGLVFLYTFIYLLAGNRRITIWALVYWCPMIIIRLAFWLGLERWKRLAKPQIKLLGRALVAMWIATAVVVLLTRNELVYAKLSFPLWLKALGILTLGISVLLVAWAVSTLGIGKLFAAPVLNFKRESEGSDEIVVGGPYKIVDIPFT